VKQPKRACGKIEDGETQAMPIRKLFEIGKTERLKPNSWLDYVASCGFEGSHADAPIDIATDQED
jgi:hypothetical protein